MTSTLLDQSFQLARELHADQTRKATSIPYVSHLLAVASLVLEDGQAEPVVAAALLHDAAEDQGGLPTVERIRTVLGDEVANLVIECSDSMTEDPEAKAPWRRRKQQAIDAAALHTESALYIIAADKLHNVRSILADASFDGPSVWTRFNAGPEEILWYHHSMAEVLLERIPTSRSVRLLVSANRELTEVVNEAGESG